MWRMEIAKWPLSESVPLLPIFLQHCSVTVAIPHSFVPAAIFNQDLFDTFNVYLFLFYREIIASWNKSNGSYVVKDFVTLPLVPSPHS